MKNLQLRKILNDNTLNLNEFKGAFTLKQNLIYYLWAFVQPLFIPNDSIVFTFGKRLKTIENNDWWTIDNIEKNQFEETIKHLNNTLIGEGLTYLKKVGNTDTFIHLYKLKKDKNLKIYEAIVYSMFFLEMDEAYKEARLLLNYIDKYEDIETEWIKQIIVRTEYLANTSMHNAKCFLNECVKNTLTNLKLSES